MGYTITDAEARAALAAITEEGVEDRASGQVRTLPKYEPTMKATIQGLQSSTFVTTNDLNKLHVSTPAGHKIGGAAAGYAYDLLYALTQDFCPAARRGDGGAYSMGAALRQKLSAQVGTSCDLVKARQERDEARAQVKRLEDYIVDTAPRAHVKALYAERDEARAELAALKVKVAGVIQTLDYYRRHVPESQRVGTSTQTLFAAVDLAVGGASEAAPAPAVTPETVVTLGMLREIAGASAAELERRRTNEGLPPSAIGITEYGTSPLEHVVDRKLGRK